MGRRAQIQPERLGKVLRGHDVLIPEHHDAEESQRRDATKLPVIRREATTVRFTRETLKAISKARSRLLVDMDLKASQSDVVEAAVLKVLGDLDALAASIRELQAGELAV